jgi:DNA-cytosine methyltransferase
MRVLSLFDGISCARVALGDRVTTYYAAEIDKHAIQIARKNYPDTHHLGDVRSVRAADLPAIDLLVGGSPCEDLSIAKKQRKGLEGDRSGLFWEYVRILREVQPTWFILENVASMRQHDRDIITRELGVEPILLDATHVSAQMRRRLFWTNIPGVTPLTDKGIVLKDILQDIDETTTLPFHKTAQTGRNATKKLGYVGDKDHQAKRIYDDQGKLPALNAICNSMVQTGDRRRRVTPIECERLQGLPDNYTEGITKSHRYGCLGKAFHVDILRHILSFLPTPPGGATTPPPG